MYLCFSLVGDSCTLPLSKVPRVCGFLVEGNSTSLTLIVDYEGCNVKQEVCF